MKSKELILTQRDTRLPKKPQFPHFIMDDNIDTFEIDQDATIVCSNEIFNRLREFSFYLIENFENNLNFWLKILEERSLPKKSNSTPINVLSTLSAIIPTVGKGIGALLNQSEIFIIDKIDKKNAQTLAKLIYYFSDNKQIIRQQLIETCIEIFYCYEKQFARLTCDSGKKRAMQKLAIDTKNRIFNYLLDNYEMIEDSGVTKDDLIKGIIYGKSIKNAIGLEKGRTVTDQQKNKKMATWKIYKRTGLYCEETGEFYYNQGSKIDKYGYRRQFRWETLENIREHWSLIDDRNKIDEHLRNYEINKEMFNELLNDINEYIMTKFTDEDAKLDRQKKHDESLRDRNEKYGKLIENIELILNYNQDYKEENSKEHENISNKLTEIHADLIVTKTEIIESTSRIENDVNHIKTKQEEIDSTVATLTTIQQPQKISLSDLIKDNYEVKKVEKVVRRAREDVDKTVKKAERDVRKAFKRIF